MPTLYDDPDATPPATPPGTVITADNGPNGITIQVAFEFEYQLLTPNNTGTTDIIVTEAESPDPSLPGNLLLPYGTRSVAQLDFDPDPSDVPQTEAVDEVVYTFLLILRPFIAMSLTQAQHSPSRSQTLLFQMIRS